MAREEKKVRRYDLERGGGSEMQFSMNANGYHPLKLRNIKHFPTFSFRWNFSFFVFFITEEKNKLFCGTFIIHQNKC